MIAPARQFVDVLMQASAQRNVELLDTAADRQNGRPALHAGTDQGQRRGIAIGVRRVAPARHRAPVMFVADIREAAGEQQTVEAVEQSFDVETITQGRDQDRQTAAFDHRIDIFVDDGMRRAGTYRLAATAYPNQR